MYPVYSNLDSNPHHKNQSPSPHFNPTWETFPSQMKENQVNTPQMHEHWPHNYAYPTPVSCQDCCSHGQYHSYYNYRPPCPHFPSPPPYGYGHYHGGYPAAYPPHYPYVPPPPHYSMGSPNGFHCCECPNHPSHVKSTNNVKIEEHEPDVETSKVESLVPARVNNSPASPYPLMWVPPEYMKYKEGPKLVGESGADEKRVMPYVENRKPNQSNQVVEQDPNARYQWFPLDMDTIKRLTEGGDEKQVLDVEKKDQNKQLEKKDQNKQFSYPVIRIPYDGLKDHFGSKTPPEAQEERKNNSKRPVEAHPSVLKVVKHPDKEIVKERASEGHYDDGTGTPGGHKTGKVRIIPVKQLDDSASKSLKKEQESSVKENLKTDGKVEKNVTDMKPSSVTKKSKLPPICLRVDPPRKKNGKDGSRFSTPPREKKLQENSKEEMKVKEVLEKHRIENDVKEEKRACNQEYQPETAAKVVQDADTCKLDAVEPQGVKGNEDGVNGAPLRKLMSETEAAVIIQSAYRGYAVRQWEPLKKLRLIADVREEATKIKGQIEKLESCITVDHKEKVAVGESIMNLLLKLDSVQGLHPSVREVRKSVAKELVMLEEKLDGIVSRQSQHSSTSEGVGEHSTAFGSVEDSVGSVEIGTNTSEIAAEDTAGTVETGTNTSEIAEQCGAVNACQNVEPQKDVFVTVDEEMSEVNKEPGRDSHNEEAMSPVGNPELCREMKENELDKLTTPENLSMVSQNTSLQFDMGSSDKEEEANLLAKSLRETVEQQIDCNKDREVDQPNVKPADLSSDFVTIEHDIVPETIPILEQGDRLHNPTAEEMHLVREDVIKEGQETADDGLLEEGTAEKCDGGVASALEVEKLEEKHSEEKAQGGILEQSTDSFEVQNADQPQIQVEHFIASEQEHCKIVESGEEEAMGARESETTEDRMYKEVDSSEAQQVDQPQTQVEHLLAIEQEHRKTVESFEEATKITDDPKCMEIPVTEVEIPVTELEKGVIQEGQEIACDDEREETTNVSTCMTDARQYKDIPEASSVSSTGEQIERRIIEENDKLRNMVEQLLASGREQQEVISNLTAKVMNLEKKMPKRSKARSARRPGIVALRGKSVLPR